MNKSFLVLFFKKEHSLTHQLTYHPPFPYALRLLLLALTALRLAVAARAPLSADEAYYWVWSKALAGGYFDHPPMVALWIRAGTDIAGDSALGVRLLAPVAALLGSLLLLRAAEDLWPGRQAGTAAVLMLNATLVLGVGAVVMTPDTPLLFFWTAALAALARLIRTGHPAWWLAVGLAGGLALDSKYTSALLGLSIALWLLASPQARRWLACWQLWAGGALALLLFAPVLAWNAAHGWVSFAKQGGRTSDWRPGDALRFLAELLAGQAGLATPGLALVFLAGLTTTVRAARRRTEAMLLACVTLLPAAIFLQHALGDRVQANWPAVIYPGAALAAALYAARFWRPAALLGALLTLALYLQATAAPITAPRAWDFTLIRLAGWPDLAGAVYVTQQQAGADYVAADAYGLAAELAFRLHGHVVGIEPRWASFSLPRANLAGHRGLLVRSAREYGPPDPRLWSDVTLIGTATRGRHGVVAEKYLFYKALWHGDSRLSPVLLPSPAPGPLGGLKPP
jgi:4-amino-4-deoxy-L-arabinose transferase-like glycosyltransferase